MENNSKSRQKGERGTVEDIEDKEKWKEGDKETERAGTFFVLVKYCKEKCCAPVLILESLPVQLHCIVDFRV